MCFMKTVDILSELRSCINHEVASELGAQLYQLYTHFIGRLLAVPKVSNEEPLDEVLKHLEQLRETWAEANAAAENTNKVAEGVSG